MYANSTDNALSTSGKSGFDRVGDFIAAGWKFGADLISKPWQGAASKWLGYGATASKGAAAVTKYVTGALETAARNPKDIGAFIEARLAMPAWKNAGALLKLGGGAFTGATILASKDPVRQAINVAATEFGTALGTPAFGVFTGGTYDQIIYEDIPFLSHSAVEIGGASKDLAGAIVDNWGDSLSSKLDYNRHVADYISQRTSDKPWYDRALGSVIGNVTRGIADVGAVGTQAYQGISNGISAAYDFITGSRD